MYAFSWLHLSILVTALSSLYPFHFLPVLHSKPLLHVGAKQGLAGGGGKGGLLRRSVGALQFLYEFGGHHVAHVVARGECFTHLRGAVGEEGGIAYDADTCG